MDEGHPDATPADGDSGVAFAVLGGPGDGATLDLDHERFAYAGKFVMPTTGKAVAREVGGDGGADGDDGGADGGDGGVVSGDGDVVAAAAFDRDRTDGAVVRVRYVTVRRDRRGEGLGARLLASLAERLLDDGRASQPGGTVETSPVDAVEEVRIAVNNPYAYEAAYKAGFGYTGERTGIAELLLARPGDRSTAAYRRGLDAFDERGDLDHAERAFLDDRLETEPPPTVRPLADGD